MRKLGVLTAAAAMAVVMGMGTDAMAGKPIPMEIDRLCRQVAQIRPPARTSIERCIFGACTLRAETLDLDFGDGKNSEQTLRGLRSKAGGAALKLDDAQMRLEDGKDVEMKLTQALDLIIDYKGKLVQLFNDGKVDDGSTTVRNVHNLAMRVESCISDLIIE